MGDEKPIVLTRDTGRYRVEKTGYGFWPYCVRCGTGTRALFVGHKRTCERVAVELQGAFEDGRFYEATMTKGESAC